jgi:dolichol-phosphate mannosyltransferase
MVCYFIIARNQTFILILVHDYSADNIPFEILRFNSCEASLGKKYISKIYYYCEEKVMNKISIVIPVYYSADTLLECYMDLKENALTKINADYEIILVDDGSGDNSWEICKSIAQKDENVRLIKLSRNFGGHAACYAGISVCIGDCAMIKMADNQEPASLIIDMYDSWKQGNRVVLAMREGREESFTQKAFANIYYKLVRRYINKEMPKTGFDCYLIDRRVIEALKLLDERHSAITLQILWTGFKTSIVPYTRVARQKGKSRWTLSKKIKLFLDSFVSFSAAPIRFVEWFGVLFAAGAFIWGAALIIARLLGGVEVAGWTTLMVIVLFSSGMIMLSLGIIGEYVWRTLDVSQNRPVYIIEEKEDNVTKEAEE